MKNTNYFTPNKVQVNYLSLIIAILCCINMTNLQAASFDTFKEWMEAPNMHKIEADFNGDGRTDIALVNRAKGWDSMPIAFSNGNGTYNVINRRVGEFASNWATTSSVEVITGDFNGDGKTDIALVNRAKGWDSMPIAFSNGNGTYNVINRRVGEFASNWATTSSVQVITGDFNANGRTDIALVNRAKGWDSMPIAFSNGNGTYNVINRRVGEFASNWATTSSVQVITGDFNANGRTDIALVNRAKGWDSMPIAFSNGNGTYNVINRRVGQFASSWATNSSVEVITGDFNGNGRTDVALVNRAKGWDSMPIAFSNGNGTYNIINRRVGEFASNWATTSSVQVITGDFNADKRTDIALVNRAKGWDSMPIAFSIGNGTYNVINRRVGEFASNWATTSSVQVIIGDFNADKRTDIALVNRAGGWDSMPIAFSNGNGTYNVINRRVGEFASNWATTKSVQLIPGSNSSNTISTSPNSASREALSVLTYNVMLLDNLVFPNHRQDFRAKEISNAIKREGEWDVVIFNEAFHNSSRASLIQNMKNKGYPHVSRVVDKRGNLEDGGVFIQSKFPILQQDVIVFSSTAGDDANANKGAIYVQIKKGSKTVHLFGTHLQADHETAVRASQLRQLATFVKQKTNGAAARGEAIIITGDLNFDIKSSEFASALNILDAQFLFANPPGHTFDPVNNGFAKYRYEGKEPQAWFDYIFVQNQGVKPRFSRFSVVKLKTTTGYRIPPGFFDSGTFIKDLSDHYGLSANFVF